MGQLFGTPAENTSQVVKTKSIVSDGRQVRNLFFNESYRIYEERPRRNPRNFDLYNNLHFDQDYVSQYDTLELRTNLRNLDIQCYEPETLNNKCVLKKTEVVKMQSFLNDILKPFKSLMYNTNDKICVRQTLDEISHQYIFASSKFMRNKTFNMHYTIVCVEKVKNPFIFAHYQLKKSFMSKTGVVERYLFHGTKQEYLQNILELNFDWRKIVRSKFGKGVSFANNPWYASNYSKRNKSDNGVMVMILAKVLIGKKCMGNPFMEVPHPGYDTTTNHDEQVLVKYDDNTFYPEFVVYFVER